jgi:hypothetical protein
MQFRTRPRVWQGVAPYIIPRPTTELELGSSAGVAGYVSWELVHARTGEVVRHGACKNLITNSGLDYFGTGVGVPNQIRVGTGSAVPAFTDTQLQAQVGATTSNGGFAQVGPSLFTANVYSFQRNTFVFLEAEANGNLTEVGLGNGGVTALYMRQLFLDGLGSPTVIVKTSAFQLRIVYEARVYLPLGDATQSMTVNGVSRNVLRRVSTFTSWIGVGFMNYSAGNMTLYGGTGSATFGAEGVLPTAPAQIAASSTVASTYVNGVFSQTVTGQWDPSVGNDAAGYKFLSTYMWSLMPREVKWDLTSGGGAPIVKTNTDKFVIAHTRSWTRV